jgi:hypothetical protein
MTVYSFGSHGREVEQIQEELRKFNHYKGAIDGIFGRGTEMAVKEYQRSKALKVDGKVGPKTWASLFEGEDIAEPAVIKSPLDERCLALTGSFETSRVVPECFAGLNGDFDGQGISFGALQWNFGQGSLQPLLREMNGQHPDVLEGIFGKEHYQTLVEVLEEYGHYDQMEWICSIQHSTKHSFHQPWQGFFKTLGRTEEYRKIQLRHSSTLYQNALDLCKRFNLWSERAAALMFDIKVQNGSISQAVRQQIEGDFGELGPGLSPEDLEVEKMRMVANRRSEASNPRWVEDVRRRKLCCAEGKGIVHGMEYDLEAQFGISLRKFS